MQHYDERQQRIEQAQMEYQRIFLDKKRRELDARLRLVAVKNRLGITVLADGRVLMPY